MQITTSIFFISAVLTFQVCNAVTIARASGDNGLDLLNQLRLVGSDVLTAAFTKYMVMCDKVDAAAQYAKANIENTALIQCVNDQASTAMSLIFALAKFNIAVTISIVTNYDKSLISCGVINETCISVLTAKVQNVTTEWLPNIIASFVEEDDKSVDDQVSLIQACGGQVAKSQKLVTNRSAANDARVALNRFRQVTIDNINLALLDCSAMCDVVDSTAVQIMAAGMDTEIENCVENHGIPAITVIRTLERTLMDNFWKLVFDAQTQLVICGESDECLKAFISDIQRNIDSTPGAINTQVQLESQTVDTLVYGMTTC